MRKVLKIVLVLMGLMLAVMLARTVMLSSLQVTADDLPQAPVERDRLAQQLAGAIQFRTISHSDASKDDVVAFKGLHDYLFRQFPRVHSRLKREVTGNHHLIYSWPGSDSGLKPALLLGHLDVVPVEAATREQWQQAPFAGKIANGFIWGRGAIDDKSTVIGLLAAAETLLGNGFQPKRTIYFAFGADEEVGGQRGAANIASLFKERNIELAFVLDEGGAVTEGIVRDVDGPVALIGIAEKGYISLDLTVKAKGGHSSMPSPQTAIGILSAALARLEASPLPARVEPPVQQMFRYLGPEMPFLRRMVLANQWLFGSVILDRMTQTPSNNASIRTTTAVTMIDGGIKENVLPTRAHAVVNFRLLTGDSIKQLLDVVKTVINDDRVAISMREFQQEPSQVAKVDAEGFRLLQLSVAQVYPDALVAPYLVVGATDSRHYAALTDNIYRFLPLRMDSADLKRLHGINERVSVQEFSETVQFYTAFMQKL